jgi:hypothetical protein
MQRFVFPLETVDLEDYTVGLFSPQGSISTPVDEHVWYNIRFVDSAKRSTLLVPGPAALHCYLYKAINHPRIINAASSPSKANR